MPINISREIGAIRGRGDNWLAHALETIQSAVNVPAVAAKPPSTPVAAPSVALPAGLAAPTPVTSLNGLTGTVKIQGTGVTVATSGSNVNLTVQVNIGGVNVQTTAYTATGTDAGKLLLLNSSSAITLTLPAPTLVPPNYYLMVQNIGVGALTISPASGTIDGAATLPIAGKTTGTLSQGLLVFTDGTNWYTNHSLMTDGSGNLVIGGALTLGTPLTVPNGGTGDSTLTPHGVLVGEGTGAVTALAAPATGTVLAGQGTSSDPAFTGSPQFSGTVDFAGSSSITVAPPSGSTNIGWKASVYSGFAFGVATNTFCLETVDFFSVFCSSAATPYPANNATSSFPDTSSAFSIGVSINMSGLSKTGILFLNGVGGFGSSESNFVQMQAAPGSTINGITGTLAGFAQSSVAWLALFDTSGNFGINGTGHSTGGWVTGSDASIKNVIGPLPPALQALHTISPVRFTFTNPANPAPMTPLRDTTKVHAGFIAQDMQKIFPEAVTTGADGLMGIDYGKLSVFLWKALQELTVQVTALQAKVGIPILG